jgi:hypothetical protein
MRFALENGRRTEAQPGHHGICPGCGAVVIPKCGEVRARHWAHASQFECDSWHEPEGAWHLNWKAHFPEAWQEIVHHASNGERHIADVKTARGCVIEFQRSPLAPEERRARDAFYPQLLWVVDATRRQADAPNLLKAWAGGWAPITSLPNLRRVHAPDNALVRDWSGCRAPVFLDVGNGTLVWLVPCSKTNSVYLLPMSCAQFVSVHRDDSPTALAIEKQWTEFPAQVALLEDELARMHQRRSATPLRGFESYLERRNRRHRRF